jgi:hypothetical protein
LTGALSTTTSVTANTLTASQAGAAGGAGLGGAGGGGGPGTPSGSTGQNGRPGSAGTAGTGNSGADPDIAGSITSVTALTVVSVKTEVDLQNQSTGLVLLATFTQGSATAAAKQYSAMVQWGDGISDTSGSTNTNIKIVRSGTNIKVYGSHAYAAAGSEPVAVWLTGPKHLLAVADTTVNVAADVTGQVGVQSSPLTYNSTTGLYDGTVTITNTSTTSIAGSLDLLFQGLTSGVTLAQASLTVGTTTYTLTIDHTGAGDPYIHIPKKVRRSLAAGASLKISVGFQEPSAATISYTPLVFSDPLDA